MTLSCEMELQNYPLDRQLCPMTIESCKCILQFFSLDTYVVHDNTCNYNRIGWKFIDNLWDSVLDSISGKNSGRKYKKKIKNELQADDRIHVYFF